MLHIISELSTDLPAIRPEMNEIMVSLKVGKDRRPDLGWKYSSCELRQGHSSGTDGNNRNEQLTKLSKEIESSRRERGEKKNVGECSGFALRIRLQGLHYPRNLNPEPLLQHPRIKHATSNSPNQSIPAIRYKLSTLTTPIRTILHL